MKDETGARTNRNAAGDVPRRITLVLLYRRWTMSWFSLLTGRNDQRRKYQPYRFRPQLEVLEGRALPSTLTVLNTLDSGPGSLRDTIAAAASGDTIKFDSSVIHGQPITL